MMENFVKKLKVKKIDMDSKKNFEFLEGVNIPDLDFVKMFKDDYQPLKQRKSIVEIF